LLIACGFVTWFVTSRVANDAYDHALLDPVMDIVQNARRGADGPTLTLSPREQAAAVRWIGPRVLPGAIGVAPFKTLTIGRTANASMFARGDGEACGKNHQQRPLVEACKRAKIAPPLSFTRPAAVTPARWREPAPTCSLSASCSATPTRGLRPGTTRICAIARWRTPSTPCSPTSARSSNRT